MKTKKSLRIVNWHFAVSLGACLLTGCASQETRKTQTINGEAETEKPAGKSGKTIASADQVPDAVKQAFRIRFPTAKLAEWKIKSDNIYEAEFTRAGTEITVMFDSTGKWL